VPEAATVMAGAVADAASASFGLGTPNKAPRAVDGPRAALQRAGDSADKAAAAEGSASSALCEKP
jgi:hypothetical protein